MKKYNRFRGKRRRSFYYPHADAQPHGDGHGDGQPHGHGDGQPLTSAGP